MNERLSWRCERKKTGRGIKFMKVERVDSRRDNTGVFELSGAKSSTQCLLDICTHSTTQHILSNVVLDGLHTISA